MQNDNYPIGGANDPKAPYNEPLLREVNVEVGVELGLFLKVEVYNEEEIEEEHEDVENCVIVSTYALHYPSYLTVKIVKNESFIRIFSFLN